MHVHMRANTYIHTDTHTYTHTHTHTHTYIYIYIYIYILQIVQTVRRTTYVTMLQVVSCAGALTSQNVNQV